MDDRDMNMYKSLEARLSFRRTKQLFDIVK